MVKQLLGQTIIVGAMLVGAIYITRTTETPLPQPITVEVPVDIGQPAEPEWRGTASKALVSPGGVIEGWWR